MMNDEGFSFSSEISVFFALWTGVCVVVLARLFNDIITR